jgi:hypothetical protein
LPTKSQLQTGTLSTTFLTSLALASFLAEAKRTFINYPTAHHNLGNSRATPSHLGDITYKSNQCQEDCFTKLKCSQKVLTQPPTWIYRKSLKPHKEVLGRGIKGFRMSVFIGGISSLQRREGEIFYTCPPKLAVGN